MSNLPQSLADLEFKKALFESSFSFEELQFKQILYRHSKSGYLTEIQRKIAEEYRNLQEAALEMNEAEMAFHKMMQVRKKLVNIYRDLLLKSKKINP
jgi:flagellar hook-basal body complex protein FliE